MVVVLWLCVFGCGSSEKPAPSCQQGISHYYTAGCGYFNGNTAPPTLVPQAEVVTFCQNAASQAPRTCQDELDDWVICNNEVPSPAMNDADCDCSVEYMALLRCP
jgi:hypothetical protein